MGLLDYLKWKRKCPKDTRIDDVLKRTDDTIATIEDGLEQMKCNDRKWKDLIGY